MRGMQHDVITPFLVATSVVTRFGPGPARRNPDPDPEVMFLAGPQGNAIARRDTADLASRQGTSVIYLEFERGSARRSPKNIMVFEWTEDGLVTYPRCGLWSRGPDDITVVLPRGLDIAFGFDGVAMRCMAGAPTKNLADGFARARAELIAIAGRVTPEMMREMTVSTRRHPAGAS